MVDVIEHSLISNAHLHDAKGIGTATAGQAYVANGAGSGAWETVNGLVVTPAFPVGSVIPYAGTVAPTGWALCYGQGLSRSTYLDLYSIIGTAYGIGDGSVTFNIPDLRGRVAIGQDNMGGSSAGRITSAESGLNGTIRGASGGSETATTSASQIPTLTGSATSAGSHTHTLTNSTRVYRYGGNTPGLAASGATIGSIDLTLDLAGLHSHTFTVNVGSAATGHNNVQPTLIMNYIIYTGVAV